jgi:hypothetical protein
VVGWVRTSTEVGLPLCYRALDLDEDEPLWSLMRQARLSSWTLPQLVLSILDRDGHPLSAGARDELDRAAARQRDYAQVESLLCTTGRARVVKGPSLARRYPAGLVRPVGDLDLVVPAEDALWPAVHTLLVQRRVEDIYVTLFGHPQRHTLVTAWWPAADPIMDPPLGVELSTAAFGGNQDCVPSRTDLPADSFLADLLSLAEERFQRPFTAKDIIDVAVLGGVQAPRAAQIVAAAAHHMLAPELAELLELARTRVEMGTLTTAAGLLGGPAERERARRAAWQVPTPRTGLDPVTTVLASGKPLGGLRLGELGWREGYCPSVVHTFEGGALLRTPVGDYLLSGDEVVSRHRHSAATAELARLGGLR